MSKRNVGFRANHQIWPKVFPWVTPWITTKKKTNIVWRKIGKFTIHFQWICTFSFQILNSLGSTSMLFRIPPMKKFAAIFISGERLSVVKSLICDECNDVVSKKYLMSGQNNLNKRNISQELIQRCFYLFCINQLWKSNQFIFFIWFIYSSNPKLNNLKIMAFWISNLRIHHHHHHHHHHYNHHHHADRNWNFILREIGLH